jgi:transglutaminase-like putative cysteine protease
MVLRRERRWPLLLALLSGMALCAWQIDEAISVQGPRLHAVFAEELAQRIGVQGVGRSYLWSASLTGIALEKQQEPNSVALRVYCPVTPGYLRSNAYDVLEGTTWTVYDRADSGRRHRLVQPAEAPDDFPPPQPGLQLPEWDAAFEIDDQFQGPLTRLDVVSQPERGTAFFTPLATAYLQGAGQELRLSEHRIVTRGFDLRQPYTVIAAASCRSPPLSPVARAHLLAVPAELDAHLMQVMAHLPAQQRSVTEKVAAVERYFQQNYRYSLEGFSTPRRQHPLAYFLRARPAAHCEFFASAAVLLMRKQGVPARYVTGFAVSELESDSGEYWIARNRHAHAWAEAYDERSQRWVIVEATPGIDLPKELDSGAISRAGGVTAQASAAEGQESSDLATILSGLRQYPVSSWAWRLAGVFFLAGLAGVAWQLIRRARAMSGPPRLARLRRLDRLVARRRIRRRADETLHAFADRLRVQAATDPWLAKAADWYVLYANLVYGSPQSPLPPLPTPQDA